MEKFIIEFEGIVFVKVCIDVLHKFTNVSRVAGYESEVGVGLFREVSAKEFRQLNITVCGSVVRLEVFGE